MVLKNINVRHTCVYLVATDYDCTYVKLIGEYTFKDAVNKFPDAEVLEVRDDIGMARVILLDKEYEGWRIDRHETID